MTNPNQARADPSRAQAEQLALLDHSEQTGMFGSWSWTPQTGEVIWSDNYYRLFGLEPGSIEPSVDYLMEHLHPADKARVQQRLETRMRDPTATIPGDTDQAPLDYRIVRDDGVVRHFHVTIAFVDEEGPYRRLVGSAQDVTSRDTVARKLAAHAAVSKALDEWEDFTPGAVGLLSGMALAMNLPFGALWIPQRSSMTVRAIWHIESPLLAILAEATRDWRPGRGSIALGRAWESRQPILSNTPAVVGTSARKAAIADSGIQAVLAVPAVADDETLAVMEFLSFDPVDDTERLLQALIGIGHEVGYFLARHRGELVAPVLTPRELEVLQLAARGLTAVEIAREMNISPATVKRHFESSYAALDVSDRASAVAQAMRQGLIT